MSASRTDCDAGVPEPTVAQHPSFSDTAEGAPEAPVARPGGNAGAIGPEATNARHTGRQGAKSGGSKGPRASESRIMATNPQDAEGMAGTERVAQVASLLAAGFLRYRLRKGADGGENGLAILRTSSDESVEPKSGGESA